MCFHASPQLPFLIYQYICLMSCSIWECSPRRLSWLKIFPLFLTQSFCSSDQSTSHYYHVSVYFMSPIMPHHCSLILYLLFINFHCFHLPSYHFTYSQIIHFHCMYFSLMGHFLDISHPYINAAINKLPSSFLCIYSYRHISPLHE